MGSSGWGQTILFIKRMGSDYPFYEIWAIGAIGVKLHPFTLFINFFSLISRIRGILCSFFPVFNHQALYSGKSGRIPEKSFNNLSFFGSIRDLSRHFDPFAVYKKDYCELLSVR
jgi:hypothetical protein